MAEILEAVLQLEISAFTASLQQAAQQVTAFAQAIQGSVSSSAQAFQQQVQQINRVAEATRQASQARTTANQQTRDEMEQLRQGFRVQFEEFKNISREEGEAIRSRNRLIVEDTRRTTGENVAAYRQQVAEISRLAAAQRQAMIGTAQTFATNPTLSEAQRVEAVRQANRLILDDMRQTNNLRLQEAKLTNALEIQEYRSHAAIVGFTWESAIGRVVTSLKTLAGYAVAAFIIALPFKLIELGKEAVQTAVKMESLNASFAGIAKGAAAGANALEFVRSVAQRVGTDFLSTADSFKSLMAASQGTVLEGDRIRKIFEQMSIAGRVLGLDAGQMQRALLALEQMISKGTISAEELRKQLGNAVPGALNIMARALGVSTEQLNSMMKAGDLLAVDVLPRFGAQVEKEFGPGMERATRTASASFARLGNELRDVSAGIGAGILKILQPVADFVAKLLEDARKARDFHDTEVAKIAAELRAGKPIAGFTGGTTMELAAGFTAAEADRAEQMVRRIVELRQMLADADAKRYVDPRKQADYQAQLSGEIQRFEELNRLIEERGRLQRLTGDSDEFGGKAGAGQAATQAQDRYKKQVEDVLKTISQLPEEMQKMASKADLLPTIYGKSEEKLRVIKKLIQETDDLIDKTPGLRLDPKIQEAMKGAETLAKIAQGEIDARKEKERLDKEADIEAKKRRTEMKQQAKEDAMERERIEQKMREAIAEMETDHAAKETEQMRKLLEDAQRVSADRTLVEKYESLKRVQINKDEFEDITKEYKKGFTDIKRLAKERMDVDALITSFALKATKTRLDDHDEEVAQKRANLQEMINQEKATQDDMEQLTANAAARRSAIEREEHDKLLKEQSKGWRELSNSIENTLSSAFYNIFTGTKNLFEGIRDAFLKLLAKLAADALTHAIIIPAIVKLFGGGGGGTAGSALGAFGLAGTGGETGASGSNSGVAQAIGLVTAGNSLSGAFGGPSLGLGTGGFGARLAATEIGRLPFIGSFFGGPGPGAAGPTTASGSITLGTIAGGAGIGIAAGMILSRIMSMLGVGGMANTTVSGAVGGAAAGTFIAPGIGTAIGAIVGALGGALAGLFGGGRKQPGFDIKEMQPGRIRYDDSIGMVVEQDFRILADFHQRLGTDYEDFTAMINDGINDMFQQVLSQIQGAHPDVQRALVDPLNSAFQDIATMIENYPAIGGEKFKEQLETMMQDFGNIFATTSTDALGELIAAVEKIDPVVKAFVTIIEAVHEDIRELQRQQKALDDTLKGNMNALEESLMTSTEILALRRAELSNLVSQFEGGDEATKIALAPQIGELTVAILELSKTVFSSQNSFGNITGIQAAIKSLEESLYTPTQLLAARQADLVRLIEQFRSGTAATQTTLGPEIAQLALEIMQLSESVYTLAEQQALMADFPAQLRAITEALFSPAQTYLSQQNQLQTLLAQFRAGTPEQQIALEPQIAQLAAQIISIARGTDVLGQDPQLLRQVQGQLLSVMEEVQSTIANQVNNQTSDAAALQATLERTQAEMITVLREVENVMARNIVNAGAQTVQALWSTAGEIISTTYTTSNGMITAQYQTTNGMVTAQYNAAGQLISTEYYIGGALQGSINNVADTDASWSSALYQIQAELIEQVSSVRESAWYSYTQLEDALWKEIELAEEQIRLLVNSLYHLETVDQVVRDALGVLGAMNARLGNPLRVDMEGSLGEQLQRDSLQTANNLLRSQQNANRAIIALLAKPAFGLTFQQGLDLGSGYTGYQHGGYIPRNMAAMLHAGEQVIPEWENRAGGGAKTISINVYGGSKDPAQIADAVLKVIEQKAGRLHESKLQVARR